MGKRQRNPEEGVEGIRKKGVNSRIGRACDRCQFRKLACDPTEHSCQQCQKANTWCTITDNLSGIPAYRGQYEYLERRIEKQHRDIQELVQQLKGLGQDVSGYDLQDSESIRYTAWQNAKSMEPSRPWEKEDKQANYTRSLVLQEAGFQGSPTSQHSNVLVPTLPSPELTPSEGLTFLTQPCRPHRSSSIYSAPPQLPSRNSTASMQSSKSRANTYDANLQPNIVDVSASMSDIQALYNHRAATSSPGTLGSTFNDLRFSSQTDMSAGPVYAPDGSTWYSYTTGPERLPNYALTTSMMPPDASAYTFTVPTGFHPVTSAEGDYPLLVIESQQQLRR